VLATCFNKLMFFLAAFLWVTVSGCATTKSVLGVSSGVDPDNRPITNPFGGFSSQQKSAPEQTYTLRTRKGDRTVELEVPVDSSAADISMPLSANLKNDQYPLQPGELDRRYEGMKPSRGDREIATTFPNGTPDEDYRRHEIEKGLGLEPSDEPPNMDESYLSKVDVAKQLFKLGRYEASLIEIDALIQAYPTNGKLYEMRGTVLDRMGYSELAVRSWKQALEFQPSDVALRRLVERKQAARNIASEGK